MKRKEPKHKYNYALLLDDNELDNYINQKTLEANRFANKIYVNTSSISALEFLKNLHLVNSKYFPQIIFVDINMPIIDGFQFIENLKKEFLAKFDSIKIIILTSSIFQSEKERALSLSKNIAFLHKPLTQESLNQL